MAVNRNHFIAPREREAVILLTALRYADAAALLGAAERREMKQTLQLPSGARGESSLLAPLREKLLLAHRVHCALARMSEIQAGARRCSAVLHEKQSQLAFRIAEAPAPDRRQREFIVRFFAFSREFVRQCSAFADDVARYLSAREREARVASAIEFRRGAHRQRGGEAAQNTVRSGGAADVDAMRHHVVPLAARQTEATLIAAQQQVASCAGDVEQRLRAIARLSAAATPPARRAPDIAIPNDADIYRRFSETVEHHGDRRTAAGPVIEMLALCETGHYVLQRDFQRLNESLVIMEQDPDAYRRETAASVDAGTRRHRLQQVEALLAFLDHGARLAEDDDLYAYPRFSRELSAMICERRASWRAIAGDLLRAKIRAEGEIGAQL